jgi:hypothetical protein
VFLIEICRLTLAKNRSTQGRGLRNHCARETNSARPLANSPQLSLAFTSLI